MYLLHGAIIFKLAGHEEDVNMENMEIEGLQEFIPSNPPPVDDHDINPDSNSQEMAMNPGEYNEIRVILNDPLSQSMTTSVSFDTHEQLFWAGTQRVICFNYFPIFLLPF